MSMFERRRLFHFHKEKLQWQPLSCLDVIFLTGIFNVVCLAVFYSWTNLGEMGFMLLPHWCKKLIIKYISVISWGKARIKVPFTCKWGKDKVFSRVIVSFFIATSIVHMKNPVALYPQQQLAFQLLFFEMHKDEHHFFSAPT